MTQPDRTYTLTGPDGTPYQSETPGTLGGHRRSKIYGRLDCPVAMLTIGRGGYVRHRVFFADEATAISAGYRPCGACLPEEYLSWRNRIAAGQPHAGSWRQPACGPARPSPQYSTQHITVQDPLPNTGPAGEGAKDEVFHQVSYTVTNGLVTSAPTPFELTGTRSLHR